MCLKLLVTKFLLLILWLSFHGSVIAQAPSGSPSSPTPETVATVEENAFYLMQLNSSIAINGISFVDYFGSNVTVFPLNFANEMVFDYDGVVLIYSFETGLVSPAGPATVLSPGGYQPSLASAPTFWPPIWFILQVIEAKTGIKIGWVHRRADNGKGDVYQRPGAANSADMIRIMEPTTQYPHGYVRFYNSHGQPIDLDGKPGPNSATHIPRNPDGSYDIPKGW